MRREIAVVLPAEALDEADDSKDVVGILKEWLYGKRDATDSFQ